MNFSKYIHESKRIGILHRKKIIIIFVASLFLVCVPALILVFGKTNIDTNALSSYSVIKPDNERIYFSINSENSYIYKSNKSGIYAVKDFLENKNTYARGKYLLPKDIDKNSIIARTTKEEGISGQQEHYFLTQTLDGIPIYGSSLVVHLKKSNEIVGASGNLSTIYSYSQQKLSEDEARQVALNAAKEESLTKSLIIREGKKYIYNQSIIDGMGSGENRISLGMYIDSTDAPLTYSTFFIVDLANGKILFKENQFKEALSRTIKNCANGSCTVVRQEGGPASSVADANAVYDIFSDVYAYFKNTFGRDSYNGSGGPYIGNVNYHFSSANASWNGQQMSFSPGLVVKDVTWHELTHALTQYTAQLVYQKQSGAMNEAMSDIFGSASDNNWTIGEQISPSSGLPIPLRSMSNPLSAGDPDKLFSSKYYCGGLTSTCASPPNDNCGVHKNSGVINKTFYLMTDGGVFNGCTIAGIGREKAHKIMYSVLNNHLRYGSNFYDFYSSTQQACASLYGATSAECEEVKKAMQATELDQQTPGTQAGPACTGIAAKAATCAGQPTSAPIPTSTTSPNALTPTSNPSIPTPTPTVTPTPTTTPKPTSTPRPTPTPTVGGFQKIGTPTPTPDQYFKCVSDPVCVKSGKSIQLCPLVCTPVPK